MADLGIVPNGAVLIRNGVVEEIGPARRVENLTGARHAREVDATGKVVMPAFVDADMALAVPAVPHEDSQDECRAFRLMSRQRVQARAAMLAIEWARYGCATVGAYTPCAMDLRSIGRILRTHQALKSRPLRIRSIFSPNPEGGEALTSKWMPAVIGKKLAAIIELRVDEFPKSALRNAAVTAAGFGYAIRLRAAGVLDAEDLDLALSAGAIALVGPNHCAGAFAARLSANGCVLVIPASEAFDRPADAAGQMRKALDDGAAFALASSYRTRGVSSFNMQFLLHLAVDRLQLTAEEAITATTWNAACSLRLSHVTGSLEPGKSADLLLMDAPDYRELPRRAGHHDASMVMRAGDVIFRTSPLIPD